MCGEYLFYIPVLTPSVKARGQSSFPKHPLLFVFKCNPTQTVAGLHSLGSSGLSKTEIPVFMWVRTLLWFVVQTVEVKAVQVCNSHEVMCCFYEWLPSLLCQRSDCHRLTDGSLMAHFLLCSPSSCLALNHFSVHVRWFWHYWFQFFPHSFLYFTLFLVFFFLLFTAHGFCSLSLVLFLMFPFFAKENLDIFYLCFWIVHLSCP